MFVPFCIVDPSPPKDPEARVYSRRGNSEATGPSSTCPLMWTLTPPPHGGTVDRRLCAMRRRPGRGRRREPGSWRRSRTGRSRPNAAQSSRLKSTPLRSSPTGSPSKNVRSRFYAAPQTRSRPRPALRARLEAPRSARTVRTPRRLAFGAVQRLPWQLRRLPSSSRTGSHGTRFQAALGPTRLAPGARGEATLTKTSSGGGSTSTPQDFRASPATVSTRPGCGARPACSCRSGRSTSPETSRSGRGFRRRTTNADRHARAGRRERSVFGREGSRRPGPRS